ncbi:Yip1 family protein [Sporomusa malonica]|uniref:Yip1 domain-containing protein n=1 Tax=Sporomusa malonica TaxID=112901 RepID=A0A1W2E340_9FIRM|nr:Yip1 family protein [Sporomusa malonica]SMD04251.1 Yip1 domain-containing protein [Sporomusa malonica]
MGSFLETVYDVLFNPKEAMQIIAEKKLTGQALVMFTIGMLVPVWAVYAGIKDTTGVPAVGFLFILHGIGSLLFWVISAAVLTFVAELFGGRGTAVGLFAALGFSHLPRVVVMPLWVIASLLPAGIQGAAFGVIGVIVVIWTLSLHVAALRGAHGLSGIKAVLVLVAPMLALIGTITVLVIFAGSALIHLPFYG